MKIRNNSGPQRCVLCLRDKDEAVREHLLTNKPCCPNCPLGDIIKEALNKTTFDSVNHNNEDSEKNISKDIVDFIVCDLHSLGMESDSSYYNSYFLAHICRRRFLLLSYQAYFRYILVV